MTDKSKRCSISIASSISGLEENNTITGAKQLKFIMYLQHSSLNFSQCFKFWNLKIERRTLANMMMVPDDGSGTCYDRNESNTIQSNIQLILKTS